MLGPNTLLYELGRAEITYQSKRVKKQLSLLDLIEEENEDLLFNFSENLRDYRLKLDSLQNDFKSDLLKVLDLPLKEREIKVMSISERMQELNVLLNPKDPDLLFARVDLPAKLRAFEDPHQLRFVRKKCLKYMGLQREVFRISRRFYKGSLKVSSKSSSKSSKKIHPPTLSDHKISQQPQWEIEPIKLIELIAALSETGAFGKHLSRRDLWSYFENQFGVSLKNAESSLYQMKHRKSSPVRFLEELKGEFIELMDK